MREIKFRAWIPDIKRMREIQSFELHEPDDVFKRTPLVTVWDHESVRAAKIKGRAATYERSDIILMQYTGLKDKNGKEIYDGDIVKATSTGNQIGIIEMENGCWNANYEKGTGNIIWPLALRLHLDEVIGNIYENPELLEAK